MRRDTFLLFSGGVDHLYVQMNDPAFSVLDNSRSILVVNFSSIKMDRYHDNSCELAVGDHPFIDRPTYIRYAGADILNSDNVAQKIADGNYRTHEQVNEDVFRRICQGFARSPHVTPRIKKYIADRIGGFVPQN